MRVKLQALFLALALIAAPSCATSPVRAETAAPAQQLFVVEYKLGPAWVAGQPMNRQALGPHAAYWTRLARDGCAIGAGPFLEIDGGMAIFTATNLDAARAIIAADPAVMSGVFVGELHGWSPRIRGDGDLPR